jgi:hypothetical protein
VIQRFAALFLELESSLHIYSVFQQIVSIGIESVSNRHPAAQALQVVAEAGLVARVKIHNL